jgi:GT2 family glycosyltransferase
MELFIVDNASSPESRRRIRTIAPFARLIPSVRNLGWAGGNNKGIRIALEEGFDAVALLNMDTRVEREWLRSLVEHGQRNPDLSILQSKILLYGTYRINSLGNRIQFLGYGYCHGYGQRISLGRPDRIDFASGASMLVKREVFERIGLFREEYFLYGEDLEFCWRARLAGYRVGLAEKSVCHHKYDFRRILNAISYVERNRLLTLLALEGIWALLLTLPALILFQIGSMIYFTCRGKGNQMLKLFRYFLKKRTWILLGARRRQAQALRILPDAQIAGGFSGVIVFAEIRSAAFHLLINPLLGIYWAAARFGIILPFLLGSLLLPLRRKAPHPIGKRPAPLLRPAGASLWTRG